MAAGQFETYDAIGLAEDVQDVIYNISPIDNPVAAMSRTQRATGTLHEWQEDSLQAAASNQLVEGADAGTDQSLPTIRLGNNTQIMGKVARITGTNEEVDKYGRDSEMAYQLELRYGELANDEELAIIGAPAGVRQTGDAGADDTGAREFACFQVQIGSTTGGRTVTNVIASIATDTAALESEMLDGHEASYILGGNPGYLMVTPGLSRIVAGFALSSDASRNRDFGIGKKVVNVVDVYESPFGVLDVVLDRNLEDNGGVGTNEHIMAGIDFQYSSTPVLRATRDYPLAKAGDAENRQIIRESTYALLNRDAHFMVDSIILF